VAVIVGLELVLPADGLLEIFDGPVGKFDDLPATAADEVVVMFAAVEVLVVGLMAAEIHPVHETAPDQVLEGAVDRRPGGPGIPALEAEIELIRREMALDVEDPA
jgi:hypothetical protein